MDLNDLICEICKHGLKDCTCADIDERIWKFKQFVEAAEKNNYNRMTERIAKLLASCQFVKPADEAQKEKVLPWEGARDEHFAAPEPRIEGEEATVDNP